MTFVVVLSAFTSAEWRFWRSVKLLIYLVDVVVFMG